jgi:hypothetical protein
VAAEPDARVKAALAAVDAKLAEWAGPCRDCAHCHQYLSGYPKWDQCANPVEKVLAFTPHMGFNGNLPDCSTVRQAGGRCGPNGKFFTPKPALARKIRRENAPPRTFWQRLFGEYPQ